MSVEVWKDGVLSFVEPLDLHNYLAQGYTLTNEQNHVPEELENENESADLEAARQLYFEKFGERPHHKMKVDTILEKLNGNQSL